MHNSKEVVRVARHSVIGKHPNTLGSTLYVNLLCTVEFDGKNIQLEESQKLQGKLISIILNTPATFSRRWKENDLLVWDD